MTCILFGNFQSKFPHSKTNETFTISTETAIKTKRSILEIYFDCNSSLVLTVDSELYLYERNLEIQIKVPVNEEISKIVAGYQHYFMLAQSGSVYVMAQSYNKKLGLTNSDFKGVHKFIKLNEFTKQKVVITDISASSDNSLFLDSDDCLWMCGNQKTFFKDYIPSNSGIPNKVPNLKIKKMFCGIKASHFFFIDKENKLYVVGSDSDSRSGSGKNCNTQPGQITKFKPEIENFDTDLIQKLFPTNRNSAMLYDSKIYSCGYKDFSGNPENPQILTLIPETKDKTFVDLFAGSSHFVAEDDQGFFWIWGYNDRKQCNTATDVHVPYTYKSKLFDESLKYTAALGPYCTIFFPDLRGSADTGFMELFEKQAIYDSQIKDTKFISALFNARTEGASEEIKNILDNSSNNEQVEEFFRWVYGETKRSYLSIFEQFNSIYENLKARKFKDDIAKLYKDENSKDFKLLVNTNDEDDVVEDEDEDEFEEIPVHKFILYARSGLFREMFHNVNEKNINNVQDFSGKTIESLELLIKYFYTNSIELTADDDPELVVEELSDAIEYYQLEKNSNLYSELKKIKNQFDLN
ncbi:hypothetical protein M0813_18558 [Anaeramoeba flamelloides]|uniref:BTB domain-containing protein n=1 Tax=Anaeramoeba flamelloides TaxID=1746091 RepID=A0ABQ8YSE6_9EUKA|nr:hypothetical protein M0813_18558 [Anaeramoeba flamelloides]